MKYEFTEDNLGKGFSLLETLFTGLVAHEMAIRLLLKKNPDVCSQLALVSERVTDALMPFPATDRTIALVKAKLENLSNLSG